MNYYKATEQNKVSDIEKLKDSVHLESKCLLKKNNAKTDYCRTENVDIIEICNMYFRLYSRFTVHFHKSMSHTN
jgi:hypothetical protein